MRPIPECLKPWLIELKSLETVSQKGRGFWKQLGHDEQWALYDLRRTFATRLNDMSIAPHVVEQLLGHSLGGVIAVANISMRKDKRCSFGWIYWSA